MTQTLGFWALFNGCPLDADTHDLAQSGNSPDTQVRLFAIKCPADTAVLLYRVAGGGHNWPGQHAADPQQVGSINRDIDASEEIWSFFRERSRITPEATATA